MTVSGKFFIGAERVGASRTFRAINPATGDSLEPDCAAAGEDAVERACALAWSAFDSFRELDSELRARFLEAIAEQILALGDDLLERGHLESGLPIARLTGERARTVGQLRLFADELRKGGWLGIRVDPALPERKPLPRSDLRQRKVALGPVVVFGASNFPLAFSVAGGDTASALAAGCPVIVKAHTAHPGTSELVGQAVQKAVRECNMPEGVFSLLFGRGAQIGVALMKHPLVKAGGFTGSRGAGRQLMDTAAARPEPIPFYAEMSSTNPVFILPGALKERAAGIASGLHASFTLGAGQFCTKPGMVFLPEGADAPKFVDQLRQSVDESAPFYLLTSGIRSAYQSSVADRKKRQGVSVVAEKSIAGNGHELGVGAALFETDGQTFLKDAGLEEEIFGPATLLVRHANREQMLEAARNFEGHLTATIHGTEEDLRNFGDLIAILENKAGRLLINGFPTGVEVSHAMVHGGPYPSTSDGRSTSVGSQAIFRFTRLICYQNFPDTALPAELKNENPLHIWRMVDGEMTREAVMQAHEVPR